MDDSILSGSIFVARDTSLNTLTVSDNTVLVGDLTVSGASNLRSVNINGNTSLIGNLNVSGTSSLSSLNVTGNSTLNTLNVSGDLTASKIILDNIPLYAREYNNPTYTFTLNTGYAGSTVISTTANGSLQISDKIYFVGNLLNDTTDVGDVYAIWEGIKEGVAPGSILGQITLYITIGNGSPDVHTGQIISTGYQQLSGTHTGQALTTCTFITSTYIITGGTGSYQGINGSIEISPATGLTIPLNIRSTIINSRSTL